MDKFETYIDWSKMDIISERGIMINSTYIVYADLGFTYESALLSYHSYVAAVNESCKKVKKDA